MNRTCRRILVLLAWTATLFPALGTAQQSKAAKPVSVKALNPTESPVVYGGVRYQSQNRRDPFLNPVAGKKDQKKAQDEEVSRGNAPPGIGGMYIAKVDLLGIATRDGSETAIFRGSDKRAYFLRVGDKLFDGSLTKIDTDTVTMVRETRYKSGRTLKQEVTKRLRPQ